MEVFLVSSGKIIYKSGTCSDEVTLKLDCFKTPYFDTVLPSPVPTTILNCHMRVQNDNITLNIMIMLLATTESLFLNIFLIIIFFSIKCTTAISFHSNFHMNFKNQNYLFFSKLKQKLVSSFNHGHAIFQ